MHLVAPNQHWYLDEFEFLRIARRRGESSCSLGGRNATLMSRCFLGCDQLAAGVNVAGTTGILGLCSRVISANVKNLAIAASTDFIRRQLLNRRRLA